LIQGITGRQASWSARDILAYGTQIVAGVVPGKGGGYQDGIPLFDFVDDAVVATGANAALVYVPAKAAAEAILESFDAGVPLVVYPGDGLPLHDAVRLRHEAIQRSVVFVGPNTPGIITPGKAKLGFMPSQCYLPGSLGVISRSGSLSYEVCYRLTTEGIGQSTVVGVGGDPIKGLTIGEALEHFDGDEETRAVLVLGEVGGVEEYAIADYASRAGAKPVMTFLVGRTAPPGRRLGHAGALIGSEREGYAPKVDALRRAGVPVAASIDEIVDIVGNTP